MAVATVEATTRGSTIGYVHGVEQALAPSRTQPVGRARPRASLAAPARRPKLGPVGGSHHAVSSRKTRLTGRGLAVCWVAAILAVAMIGFGFARGLQPSAPQVVGSQAVVVESGDTLWQLARQVNPRVDPRATISAIRQVNGLGSSSVVQEGTTLAVPIYR